VEVRKEGMGVSVVNRKTEEGRVEGERGERRKRLEEGPGGVGGRTRLTEGFKTREQDSRKGGGGALSGHLG